VYKKYLAGKIEGLHATQLEKGGKIKEISGWRI
jgi:hypothetical protein